MDSDCNVRPFFPTHALAMKKASIGLAPEGIPYICLAAFTTLLFGVLEWCIPALILLLVTAFCLHFFRDPERVVPAAPGLAVSPADGKVIRIAPRPDPLTGEEKTCISVFMNVFNVHVNRTPVAGRVTGITYWPGTFLNASLDKASENNERCALGIEDMDGASWTVVQIAGLIARRIVCRTEEGDRLERGERFGLIKFGSRVDLYLPSGYDVKIKIGDITLAGMTVLAAKGDLKTGPKPEESRKKRFRRS